MELKEMQEVSPWAGEKLNSVSCLSTLESTLLHLLKLKQLSWFLELYDINTIFTINNKQVRFLVFYSISIYQIFSPQCIKCEHRVDTMLTYWETWFLFFNKSRSCLKNSIISTYLALYNLMLSSLHSCKVQRNGKGYLCDPICWKKIIFIWLF